MKNKYLGIGLSVRAALIALSVFAQVFSLFAQTDSISLQIDSQIKIEEISGKAIVVKFGYDAITAVATTKGIVVIDAGISTGLTGRYRRIIEKKFKRNDFAYLINTHGHADHCRGNSVFAGAKIVAHEYCLQEIDEQWKDPEKVKLSMLMIINEYDKQLGTLPKNSARWNEVFCQRERYRDAYEDVLNNRLIEKPTVTFSDSLNLDMGDVTFHMIFFGKAHSGSDILIHIPEMKILMTGDLFSKYGRPAFDEKYMTNTERWLKATEWIGARWADIDKVIGGHGQIMTKDDLQSFCDHIKKSAGH